MDNLGYIDDENFYVSIKQVRLTMLEPPAVRNNVKRQVLSENTRSKMRKTLADMQEIVVSKADANPDVVKKFQANCLGCAEGTTICLFARLSSLIGPAIHKLFPGTKIIGIQFSNGHLVRHHNFDILY